MANEFENEKAFEGLTEALKTVTDSYNPDCTRAATICISDGNAPAEAPSLPGEALMLLPQVDIYYYKNENLYFTVYLKLDGYVTAFSGSAIDCWRQSRYHGSFEIDEETGRPCICFDDDVETVAKFVSYYLRLFGYGKESDFTIHMSIPVLEGKKDSPELTEDITVPDTLRRAVSKLKELAITDIDGVLLCIGNEPGAHGVSLFAGYDDDRLVLSCEHSFRSREELEEIKRYRNSDMFSISYDGDSYFLCWGLETADTETAMRFMMDYYRHFNEGKESEPSVEYYFWLVDINVNEDGYFESDRYKYRFNADGSESSPETLQSCMSILAAIRYE